MVSSAIARDMPRRRVTISSNSNSDSIVTSRRRARDAREGRGATPRAMSPARVVRLDAAIRAWVLLPIAIATFLVGALRHHATRLTRDASRPDVVALREANAATRAERCLARAGYLRAEAFAARREHYCAADGGALRKKSERASPHAAMLSDPRQMTRMMTKNAMTIAPNMLTAAWVNFFFAGFVVGRTPFPLTQRFRGMLQRGVALQSLDVTYVSSLSWYFLNFFGLGGVFQLVLGDNELDDAAAMQNAFASGLNADKAFARALEGLEALKHEHTMHIADARATAMLRALNEGKSPREARRAAAAAR